MKKDEQKSEVFEVGSPGPPGPPNQIWQEGGGAISVPHTPTPNF